MSARGRIRRALRPGPRGALVALVAALSSCATLAWTGWRALVLEPLPGIPAAASPAIFPSLTQDERPAGIGAGAAVTLDPFVPGPRSPAGRMVDADQPAGAAEVVADAPLGIILLGTAVLPEGRSFALVRAGPEPPRMIRLGEGIAGLTLRELGQRRAVFTSATGVRVEILLSKPGS